MSICPQGGSAFPQCHGAGRPLDTVNRRAIRILLECILVLHRIDIEVGKIKLFPVGIKLTTDQHWFRSLMLIQLCQPDVLNRRFFKLNFVSGTTSLFGLGSFLDSIEHDFIRISKSETGMA